MFACIPSSSTCYLWLQIGWDYTFVNEARVFLYRDSSVKGYIFFSRCHANDDVTSVSKVFGWLQLLSCCQRCSRSHKRPFCSTSSSPCPRAQKKVHCASREWVRRGLVLVSAMCCIWNAHLPPGFASGAGFLFRLHWAGAGFGAALWLAQADPLWTPGWLELPNSNPSITGIQIQTRA